MIGIFEIGIIMMMVPVCIMILVLVAALCIIMIHGIRTAYTTRDAPALIVWGLMASLLIGTILVIASGV
jgi:TRAP-type mannitol/chloroaromatic compound transport system permease small subunit